MPRCRTDLGGEVGVDVIKRVVLCGIYVLGRHSLGGLTLACMSRAELQELGGAHAPRLITGAPGPCQDVHGLEDLPGNPHSLQQNTELLVSSQVSSHESRASKPIFSISIMVL